MVMPRYEFLARALAIWQPSVYLEIGVQLGSSLALAEAAEYAIGVDPHPIVTRENVRPNQDITAWTSQYFFDHDAPALPTLASGARAVVDFGYIDGSHLFEDALSDFIALERYCGSRSVIMFDDVLPYNQAIAVRTQPPGDWTGDVWKIYPLLSENRPDLLPVLVDVAPCGLLMVFDLDPASTVLAGSYDTIMEEWQGGELVDSGTLERVDAISADAALDLLDTRKRRD